MTAKTRVIERHDHDVSEPGRDSLLATWANVGFECLKRLHDSHLSLVLQRSCQFRQVVPGLLGSSSATCHPFIVGSSAGKLATALEVRQVPQGPGESSAVSSVIALSHPCLMV